MWPPRSPARHLSSVWSGARTSDQSDRWRPPLSSPTLFSFVLFSMSVDRVYIRCTHFDPQATPYIPVSVRHHDEDIHMSNATVFVANGPSHTVDEYCVLERTSRCKLYREWAAGRG